MRPNLPDPWRAEPGVETLGVIRAPDAATMLAGYRGGLFVMPVAADLCLWYSPDPRAIIPAAELHVSRSLRRSLTRFRVTFDEHFGEVVRVCARLPRRGGWITPEMIRRYERLHAMGHAHSAEVWQGDTLAGGLFGVEVGGLFAGESMFHSVTDGSKAAMVAIARHLQAAGGQRLFDVQWLTPHLASMGAIDLRRREYLRRLQMVLRTPPSFGDRSGSRT